MNENIDNSNLVQEVEGGKKVIQTAHGPKLRRVFKQIDGDKYFIQLNNQMPEVTKINVNNVEVFICFDSN